jgi:hypothetical protein
MTPAGGQAASARQELPPSSNRNIGSGQAAEQRLQRPYIIHTIWLIRYTKGCICNRDSLIFFLPQG